MRTIILLLLMTSLAHAQTWEEMVMSEIERKHEIRLEEKRIETLKRLQSDTNIYVSSKAYNNTTTGVSNVNKNNNL